MVQDVYVAQKLWGKNIVSLKVKTTHRKPNIVARYKVNIPVGLIKFHKEAFPSCNLYFVKKIPFFLVFIRKIYFTEVNCLANNTVPEISKAFKDVYQYYLHRDFCIATVHVDG